MARLVQTGSTEALRRQLFPIGFAGEVMLLVFETWSRFALRHEVRHETPITALLRNALRDAYVAANRGWFVTLEEPINDPEFGTELGRNDLRFYPPNHYGQTIFFTVECKRLRVKTETGFYHLANDYVDQGMMRFVNGQYSNGLPCGGILGYVMDNSMGDAFVSVTKEIESKKAVLKISSRIALKMPSKLLPDQDWSADTHHIREDGDFVIHHLLVGVLK
jgi:hypothetical protein